MDGTARAAGGPAGAADVGLTPEELAQIERWVAEEQAEAKTERGQRREARLRQRREYAERQRRERWAAYLRQKAWREREEQAPTATLPYGRVRDPSRPEWHLIDAAPGTDAGARATLCRFSRGREGGWGRVVGAAEAPGRLCGRCAGDVFAGEERRVEAEQRGRRPHYGVCKLGARWFWVAWAAGVNPYGNWGRGPQETLDQKLGLDATATGTAADREVAVAEAIRAAGAADYPAAELPAGWASQYHKRLLLKTRAERRAAGQDATGVELLWTASWHTPYDSPEPPSLRVASWRVVKKSKARVYVDREAYQPERRRSGSVWDYDVRTHVLDRAQLEREGWAERARRWYEDDFRYYARRGDAVAAANRQTVTGGAPAGCLRALGLTPPCTQRDVKRAYRKLARTAHPDRGGTHEGFLALQGAYEQALRLTEGAPG